MIFFPDYQSVKSRDFKNMLKFHYEKGLS